MKNSLLYDLDYLQKRVMQIKPTSVDIYYDQITPDKTKTFAKAQTLRPTREASAYDYGEQFEFFRANTFGLFTAVLRPSMDIIYFANHSPIGTPGEQTIPNFNVQSLIDEAVRKELRNRELEEEKAEWLQEREELNDKRTKFETVAINILTHFFGTPQAADTTPLQGNKSNNNTNMAETPVDFKSIQINDLESALICIVQAFGQDWTMRFAKRLQNEPGMVAQIKTYIP